LSTNETESGWREVGLFPEDAQATELVPTIEPPAARAQGAAALDWEYLNKMFDAGNFGAMRTHCVMRQVEVETVLRQIENERGIQEQADDDND
jgi:hypothetical protein